MKKYHVPLAMLTLVLASLACQTLTGGSSPVAPAPLATNGNEGGTVISPTQPPSANGNVNGSGESQFPIPPGATNVMDISGTTNFQVKMTLAEGMDYYRTEFGKLGYVERKILTVTSDTTFSMVFDGHPSGQAIVVQGVDLGKGMINISIRLEST